MLGANLSNTHLANSLDAMFRRKRGRPPKNRIIEVWNDNVCIFFFVVFLLFLFQIRNGSNFRFFSDFFLGESKRTSRIK